MADEKPTKATPAKSTPAKASTTPATSTTEDTVVVADRAVDLPEDTEAAANEARTSEVSDELREVNPATTPGDNLPANATLTENPANLPGPGTGYHCGICGQPVSATGEHYDGDGDVVSTPHANTLVVADNWPQQVQAGDEEAATRKALLKGSSSAPETGRSK